MDDDGGIGGKCTCVQLIAINKELPNFQTIQFIRLALEEEKNGNFVVTSSDLYLFFFYQFIQYKGQKEPIYLYCEQGSEGDQVTKPGKNSVVLGYSLCDVSVLESQVFGKASMENCGYLSMPGYNFVSRVWK